MVDIRQDCAGDVPRAAAAESCGDGDILFAADAERYGEALHGSAESNLPEGFSCVHVDGAEVAVEVADERDASVRRKHGGQKRGPLLQAPDLFHGLDVEGGEFPHVAVGAWHFVKLAVARRPARSLRELDFASGHFHTALAERNDEPRGSGVIAHRLPVVATFGAGAGWSPFADFLLHDVGTIGELAGLVIDAENILVDGFLGVDKLAGLAVEFPEDACLADGENRFAVAYVH